MAVLSINSVEGLRLDSSIGAPEALDRSRFAPILKCMLQHNEQLDRTFHALADESRRALLDRLFADNGQTLSALCEDLAMSRQAVTKHLAILEAAGLVVTRRVGREKHHFLNPAPIGEIYDRWIGKYDRGRVQALADLKRALEEDPHG